MTESGVVPFQRQPLLVFWETTRACALACQHCRAAAQPRPSPDELTTAEGRHLIEELARFERRPPILVLTGGDCLMRDDIFELVEHAVGYHIPVAISPSVTPRLSDSSLSRMREMGVKTASISLDGATPDTHDGIRGIVGHFDATIAAIGRLVRHGFTVQVNSTVMARNLAELADLAAIVSWSGATTWEVFFLVSVGRGTQTEPVSADEAESVCAFLTEAAQYGSVVRTVEAPFFRRVAHQRGSAETVVTDDLGHRLVNRLQQQLGQPSNRRAIPAVRTRDGQGIIFVAYNGDVYPSGFLPLPLGNVRRTSLVEIYRTHPLLLDIRAARFTGRCGECEYRQLCGGSRARAYAATGDPLGEDPACVYQPRA